MKICPQCKISKSLGEFKHTYCIECKRILDKEYYLKNKTTIKKKTPQEMKEYNSNYYLSNKDYFKDYKNKNKEKIKEWVKDWSKEKYKNDVNFKIRKLISHRLNMAINFNFKKGKTLELLNCSIPEFKIFIENQFKPEMNWSNHGEIWELDHIIPCSSFDLVKIEEQKKCFHYSNYQPLFKTTEISQFFNYENQIGNRNKSNKI